MLTQSRVEKQITGKEKIDNIGIAWNECKDISKVVFYKNSNGQPGELKVKKELLQPERVNRWIDRIRRVGWKEILKSDDVLSPNIKIPEGCRETMLWGW